MFAHDFKQYIHTNSVADVAKFHGINHDELVKLQILQDVQSLPIVYQEFMKLMGHRDGGIFDGTTYEYGSIHGLKKMLLEDSVSFERNFTLPTNAFVFMCHQGYAYYYFICDGNDDPPVYLYDDNSTERIINDKLSKFFYGWVNSSFGIKN